MTTIRTLYGLLPSPLRDVAAGLRGWQLSRWRYGPETGAMAAEAVVREGWSEGRWRQWQGERLGRLIRHAGVRVPAYRDMWAGCEGLGNRDPFDILAGLPVLTKAGLRDRPERFLAEGLRGNDLWVEHTSGTTGTPLRMWHTRETLRGWYALVEARWRGWYGFDRRTPWAILGGQLVVPPGRRGPPYWVRNRPMRQLYLSAHHLSADSAPDYLRAIARHGARYLLGYTSALAALAGEIVRRNLDAPPLEAVISNAEPLHRHQREMIGAAFGCAVRETYGMSEMVCAASECGHGRLHLWPDCGVHEVLRLESDEPAAAGEVGRLVCTGLLGLEMPLVRYETGDLVAVADPGERCPCGRGLPVLLRVEGRNDDVIVTPGGRHVGRLDPVFKADMDIVEAQVVQDAPGHVEVRVVRGAAYSGRTEGQVRDALVERLDGMEVSFRYVTALPRGRNGKFKAVVSMLRGVEPGRTGVGVGRSEANG